MKHQEKAHLNMQLSACIATLHTFRKILPSSSLSDISDNNSPQITMTTSVLVLLMHSGLLSKHTISKYDMHVHDQH